MKKVARKPRTMKEAMVAHAAEIVKAAVGENGLDGLVNNAGSGA